MSTLWLLLMLIALELKLRWRWRATDKIGFLHEIGALVECNRVDTPSAVPTNICR